MPELTDVQLSAGSSAPLEWHDEVAGTNALMRERFVDQEERFVPFHSIATGSQTAGRGRLDREWVAPAGASLAISTYLEFSADAARESIGWVPLAAGVALRDALVELAPTLAEQLSIKWPNDLLLNGKKVSGILGEMLGVVDGGERFACVVGVGVNLTTPESGLPTERAIALDSVSVEVTGRALAATFVRKLATRILELTATNGDADAAGLRADLLLHCSTIDSDVRVTLPGDADLVGRAIGITAQGNLEVRDARGEVHAINVGDIEHVRPAGRIGEGE
ncbi:biotin--[acetyl-CoA-carboxylase] ligase [Gulosibacter molinativorax]|nr:biotin--[acetyl-CoA-carboxylase] ligase [Gulosibacter molinativorax]QUY63607.1 Bifunctional ligase/repressor BirA [Gulosibacter molinativorax]